MTPIQVLIEIGLRDLQIAMRLQVTKQTVSRWRLGLSVPYPRHQLAAKAYLAELQNKITPVLQSA